MNIYSRLNTTIAALILSTPAIAVPADAQAQVQDQCQSAINYVRQDIDGRIGGMVASVETMEAERSPFPDARQEVIFYLEANMMRGSALKNPKATPAQIQANANVVNSLKLGMEYATKIINSCSVVARVYFVLYELTQGYSLHQDRVIRRDRCYHGRYDYVPWGEQVCA